MLAAATGMLGLQSKVLVQSDLTLPTAQAAIHPPHRIWSDSRIAEALDTSIANIERTRRQLVEQGFESVLTRKYNPNSARPRIFDGAAEAKLIALTCGPAPAGHAKWSLRLLEQKVVELNIVRCASDNTIGRTLKKTFSSRISSSNG
jgi:hypothetical protein